MSGTSPETVTPESLLSSPAQGGKPAEPPKFEAALAKLEAIVERMESGKLSLDELIASFEEGRALAKLCSSQLEAVKLRIEKVAASGGLEPLEVK